MTDIPTIRWDDIPEPMRKEMNISREGFEEIVARGLDLSPVTEVLMS